MSAPEWAHEAVQVVAPDPRWPELAAAEIARVSAALRSFLSAGVQHVGSTSVPGLEAKPILDLLAGVTDLAVPAEPALAPLGFELVPPEVDRQPWRRLYVLPKAGRRYAHLHLVVPAGAEWLAFIRFRDRLRRDAELRNSYAALKRELAARHQNDREAYTSAKAGFISSALAGAE